MRITVVGVVLITHLVIVGARSGSTSAWIYAPTNSVNKYPKLRGATWNKAAKYERNLNGGYGRRRIAKWSLTTTGNATYYCSSNSGDCPKIPGGSWEKRSPSESERKVNIWVMPIENGMIYCQAKYVSNCPDPQRDYGEWRQKKAGTDNVSNYQWLAIIDGERVFCQSDNVKNCPRLEGQMRKWEPNLKFVPKDERKASSEEVEVLENRTLYCYAKYVHNCPHPQKKYGEWWPTKMSTVDHKKYRWFTIIDGERVYCQADTVEKCPKLEGQKKKWKYNPKYESKDWGSTTRSWGKNFEGVKITCIAEWVSQCQEKFAAGGKWYPIDIANRDVHSAKWVARKNGVRVYCRAYHYSECPTINGQKWKTNPKFISGNDDEEYGSWKVTTKGVTMVCVAKDAKHCQRLHNGGRWRPNNDINLENNAIWTIKTRYYTTLYCTTDIRDECPEIDGYEWIPATVAFSNSTRNARTKIPIDVGQITPAVVNRRFAITHNEVTMLCYAHDINDCPKIMGKKWWRTNNSRNTSIVVNDVTQVNVWVKNLDASTILCVHGDKTKCLDVPNENVWLVIRGNQAGLWKTKHQNIVVFCESYSINSCHNINTKWTSIAERGKQNFHSQSNSEKLNMWCATTFSATYYCNAVKQKDCPTVTGGKWRKVVPATYSNVAIWEREVKQTMYYCKAFKRENCPILPENLKWKTISEPWSTEVMIKFFSDIRGFKHFCTRGICSQSDIDM